MNRIELIGKLLSIDGKDGKVVPFHFNAVQRYFHTHKGYRNIILKGRQLGVSSSILADMFMDCITIPNMTCAVVSHETRATQRLLDRVQFYYDRMPEPKPLIGAESRSEKTFPDLHSSIYVGTAGARAFSRGDMIRRAHLSEIAFYEDGAKLLSGIEDSVPLTGELTLESTPNGENNIFYERWRDAREGKSPYKPFFFPWWMGGDFRIPRDCTDPKIQELLRPDDIGELAYTDEEQDLVERVRLSEDQIRWRRFKINEKGANFWQEYPENEVDCFSMTGDPVFDQVLLTDYANHCYQGERHQCGWQFWLPPTPNTSYLIGADTSPGAQKGSYSAAAVLDNKWQVVATFQARIEPHTFAGILKDMGKWYNNAEIIVERNFTGYAVLEQLHDYGNIFYQRDFTTGKIMPQKGWWTNDSTRDLMLTVAKEKLEQTRIWDVNLVRQLRSYKYIKMRTKYRETAQSYDDLAMALMMAMVIRKIGGVGKGYRGQIPY